MCEQNCIIITFYRSWLPNNDLGSTCFDRSAHVQTVLTSSFNFSFHVSFQRGSFGDYVKNEQETSRTCSLSQKYIALNPTKQYGIFIFFIGAFPSATRADYFMGSILDIRLCVQWNVTIFCFLLFGRFGYLLLQSRHVLPGDDARLIRMMM